MILVTRFNGTKFYINAEMVMTVEATPDTVITLNNNTKVVVREKAEDVVKMIFEYIHKTHQPDLENGKGV